MNNKPFALLGAGDVYLDILTDTGASTGLTLKGNCTKLSVKPDSELIEEFGASDTNFGQTIASVSLPKPMTAEAEFNQVDADLFAIAFMGTNSLMKQNAETIMDQSVVTNPDKMVLLGKYKISDVVVTDSGGTTTYTEGEDYIVNSRVGGITALSSGAISGGDTVLVDYRCESIDGSVMQSMTKNNVRAKILWEGQNYADGREFILNLHQARFAPSQDFNFQSAADKKFLRVAFKMTLETPVGKDAPFELVWLG